jgi:hypothetical protein
MPNRIKPKRSYTANAVPVVSGGTPDIERNEIAINWTDSKLYTRNNSDQLVSITLGGGGGGGGSVVTAATVSAFPATGSSSGVIYVATDTARAYIWAGAYIEVGANGGGGAGISWSSVPASAFATGTAGQIAYDSDFFYVAVGSNRWERAALSTWTPVASIAGLQAWYDASDTSTLYDATSGGSLVAADGAVARWEDKSVNGRHATQATSGSRPIRKSNQRNGLDAILFDGTNDFLSFESIEIPTSHSVFQVYQRLGGVQSIGIAGELSRYPALWFSDGVLYQISNTDFTTHGTSSASTGYFLVSTIRNATASIELRRNGSTVSSVTTGSGVTNAVSGEWTYIGNRTAGNFHSGNLCEIIIYDTALSDTNRGLVESYLMSKWGIA